MIEDKYYRWIVVAYTLVIQAVAVGTLIYCFALFAVEWLHDFDAERRDIMLAISLLQIGFGVMSPFAGRAMDRFAMRSVVLVGAAAFGAGLMLLTQATKIWQVYVLYATLFPFAMALMGTLASQALVTRWFQDKRGFAIGVSAMGTNLGGIALPMFVGWFLVNHDWREAVMWLAAGGVLATVPLTLLVLSRRAPSVAGQVSEPESDLAVDRNSATPSPSAVTVAEHSITPRQAEGDRLVWTTTQILRSPRFWLPVAAFLPLNLTFGAVQFNLGALASDQGLGDQAGLLIALCSACMIAGKLFFGGLADVLDHRYLVWTAISVMSIALLLLASDPGIAVFIGGVVCVGLAGGGILPMMAVVLGARFPLETFGRVMGLVMLTVSGASLGPFLAGWVFDVTGSYNPVLVGFLVMFLPVAIMIRWLPLPLPLPLPPGVQRNV